MAGTKTVAKKTAVKKPTSGNRLAEVATHRSAGVVDLAATGTTPAPKQLTGDLAQVSVGASGSAQTQVVGLSEWSIDWKRKTADATNTDNAAYESSLPSTASWTAKAKFMFTWGDPSQNTEIISILQSPTAPAQVYNFFPDAEVGQGAFQGLAFIESLTVTGGMGKVFALDVSLKGTGPLRYVPQLAPIANPNTVTGLSAQV